MDEGVSVKGEKDEKISVFKKSCTLCIYPAFCADICDFLDCTYCKVSDHEHGENPALTGAVSGSR